MPRVGRRAGLTIHSSRRRFAARLNSGVRRQKAFVCGGVAASAIAGSVVALVGMLVGAFSFR